MKNALVPTLYRFGAIALCTATLLAWSAGAEAAIPHAAQNDGGTQASPPAVRQHATPYARPDSGTAQQGVIKPPPTGDAGINKDAPPPSRFPTPVIHPPGTPGGNPDVIPK
jgi:hypothetical protein